MLKKGLLFLLLVLPSVASAADTIHPTWIYNIFKNHIFNFDTFLSENTGLTPMTCEYQSYVSGKKARFMGLGTCLFMSLADGVETQNVPGRISAQVSTPQTHTQIPVDIIWRPGRGSWFHLFKRLYRDWRRKPQVGEKDGLLGTVIFSFPPESQKYEAEILQNISFILPLLTQTDHSGFSKVTVSTKPSANDARRTDTKMVIYGTNDTTPIYHVQFSWDFYIVNPPPTVNIKAQVGP